MSSAKPAKPAKSAKRKASNLANPVATAANAANAANAYPYFVVKMRTSTILPDGTKFLYKLRNGQSQTEIYEFFKGMIVSNEGIKLADDGIYTWILIASDKDPYGDLYAAKTISMQEIGTLHKNIYDTMTKLKPVIVAAGEFEKKGKKITFNLLSGTFMEPKVKGKNSPTRRAIMKSAENSIKKKFKVYTLKVNETPHNILAPAKLRTNSAMIARLNAMFNRTNAANEPPELNDPNPPKRAKSAKAKPANAVNA